MRGGRGRWEVLLVSYGGFLVGDVGGLIFEEEVLGGDGCFCWLG